MSSLNFHVCEHCLNKKTRDVRGTTPNTNTGREMTLEINYKYFIQYYLCLVYCPYGNSTAEIEEDLAVS